MSNDAADIETLVQTVRRVAQTEVTTVLVGHRDADVLGVASLLHKSSLRAQKPMTIVPCGFAKFPWDHFAAGMRSGGTVVLHNVEKLPPPNQRLVLGVLKDKKIDSATTDARIVATTDSDLDALASRGAFDPELSSRLQMFMVKVPFVIDLDAAMRGESGIASSPTMNAQLAALRAERLIAELTDDVISRLLARQKSRSIVELLLSYYEEDEARAKADRFLVHDARFGQETDDVIAELSALLGEPPLFVQVDNSSPDEITVRGPNGEERIYLDAGLDDVVFHFNRALEERGELRIVQLTTGDTRLAYFALTLSAVTRLKAAGLSLYAP